MKKHPYMDQIKDETYDRYRDLNGVWADEQCKDKFMKHNTLLIDSDDKKVQLHLENSITNEPYTFEDVQLLSPLGQDVDAPKRGEEWQRAHCERLCDFVIRMADECDDVTEWLSEHKDFEPKNLLYFAVVEKTAEETVKDDEVASEPVSVQEEAKE